LPGIAGSVQDAAVRIFSYLADREITIEQDTDEIQEFIRSESEWIKTTDPTLRLISDELWQAAHARLNASRAVYLTRNDGRPGRRPEAGVESKYRLSGFLRCEACGGNMVITTRTGERGQPQVAYICATHRARPGSCPVRNGLLADDIHARVVELLAEEVFTPERPREAIVDIARQRDKMDAIDAEGREATVSHGMSIRYSPTRGSVAGAPMFMK
jgi:hypothetical protein